ncbi:MAG: hypothetical protein HQ515_23430, partial [Phycisphaeraceae bacterium]|nr:hypothetical protein [Phycisphaeraceae bacterium]
MRTGRLISYCALVGIVCAMTASGSFARTSRDILLKQAEPRLRAIYDDGAFRPRRFSADWLSDGSGYTVMESVSG